MIENQELELEYTFLASELPKEIEGISPTRLVDIYIPESGANHSCLRLRQKGNTYEITKKSPMTAGDASTQLETTIKLDANEFVALSSTSKKRIVKDRYVTDINGFPAEVDIFRGELEGLVLIDFEFLNEEERSQFIKPDVCLADVTQEDFIAGGLLAGKAYDDISDDLKLFNYEPLV